MSTFLDDIRAYKLDEIARAKTEHPLADLEADVRGQEAPRGFREALHEAAREGYGLIAEVKKASPSKGVIREAFDPARIAEEYAAGGAACLSVLTDGPSFQGSAQALRDARAAVTLPVLRKDFLFDPYQVTEARAWGADCVLLILAALDDGQAQELEAAALDHGMDVLIEVHDRAELERAEAHLKSSLLGINNRDLHTFETSLEVTKDLVRRAPVDALVVSESGLSSKADLDDLAQYGTRCFLIGESLMRADDIAAATRAMLADPVRGHG